jgi:hypothetical protein
MQVNHGKAGPLNRIKPGDTIIYYSPTSEMGGGSKVRSFTAAGRVADKEPYAGEMGGDLVATRRDVDWFETKVAPIAPLLDDLEFTRGKKNWGYVLRFGVVKISDADRDIILATMKAG